MTTKYKREWKPTMTLENFEEANTEYLQNEWINNNPELAYMINDGDLEKYYDDIDRDSLKETMIMLYEEFLDF